MMSKCAAGLGKEKDEAIGAGRRGGRRAGGQATRRTTCRGPGNEEDDALGVGDDEDDRGVNSMVLQFGFCVCPSLPHLPGDAGVRAISEIAPGSSAEATQLPSKVSAKLGKLWTLMLLSDWESALPPQTAYGFYPEPCAVSFLVALGPPGAE